MLETTLQTFRGSAVFTMKIVGAFKTDTHIAQKRASTTQARERDIHSERNINIYNIKW